MSKLISPFAKPDPNLVIQEGAPQIKRPTKEEVAAFPAEAQELLESSRAAQKPLLAADQYDLRWLEGRHILLGGATGPGLGGALATAVLSLGTAASVTIIGRDLSRSLNYETGQAMQAEAEANGWGQRFHWLNDGLALEGKPLEQLLAALKEAGAGRVVYFNTVAAAISGVLPGYPPIFVKDIADDGLFQWQLKTLSEQELKITNFVMGEMAVQFPKVLEDNGIVVEASVFADWRGSLDRIGRDPAQPEYGRQGAYSGSLYLPKDILQAATKAAYGTDKLMLDIFYPMMRTRALAFIPGGLMMAGLIETLMRKEGIRKVDVPELALQALDRVGKALSGGYDNPFPHLDTHDAHLDAWMFEVAARLNNDENSEFYYKLWT
jgi:hypothetical protein